MFFKYINLVDAIATNSSFDEIAMSVCENERVFLDFQSDKIILNSMIIEIKEFHKLFYMIKQNSSSEICSEEKKGGGKNALIYKFIFLLCFLCIKSVDSITGFTKNFRLLKSIKKDYDKSKKLESMNGLESMEAVVTSTPVKLAFKKRTISSYGYIKKNIIKALNGNVYGSVAAFSRFTTILAKKIQLPIFVKNSSILMKTQVKMIDDVILMYEVMNLLMPEIYNNDELFLELLENNMLIGGKMRKKTKLKSRKQETQHKKMHNNNTTRKCKKN